MGEPLSIHYVNDIRWMQGGCWGAPTVHNLYTRSSVLQYSAVDQDHADIHAGETTRLVKNLLLSLVHTY